MNEERGACLFLTWEGLDLQGMLLSCHLFCKKLMISLRKRWMNWGTTACTSQSAKPLIQTCKICFWWSTGVKHNSNKNFLLRICTSTCLCQGSGYSVTRIWNAGDGRLPRAAAEVKSLDEMLGYSLIPAQVMTNPWAFQQYFCVWHLHNITRKTIKVVRWGFFLFDYKLKFL